MNRICHCIIPHAEAIASAAILLLIGIVSGFLFETPPLWKYIAAGVLWLLLFVICLLELLDIL